MEQKIDLTQMQVVNDTSIYDSLVECVFIIDPTNHHILYTNNAANVFLHRFDLVGKCCYKAFNNLESPCKDCISANEACNHLNNKTVKWNRYNKFLNSYFNLTDQFINFKGKLARVEIVVNSLQETMNNLEFEISVATDKISSMINSEFAINHNRRKAIESLLNKVSSLFHTGTASMYKFNEDKELIPYCTNDAEGINEFNKNEIELDNLIYQKMKNNKDNQLVFSIRSLQECQVKYPDLYEHFIDQNIFSTVKILITYKGNVYGLLSFNNAINIVGYNFYSLLYPVSKEITYLVEQDHIYKEAYYDKTTELPSFLIFIKDILRRLKSEETNKNLYIVKFDIDKFQYVNHYYGFENGNLLLKNIAKYFTGNNFSNSLSITRVVNSNNFYFLFQGHLPELKKEIAKFITNLNQNPEHYKLALSFGIYKLNDHDESTDSIDNKVSIAHKMAKDSEINSIVVYDKQVEKESLMAKELLSNFDKAIREKEFVLYIQPEFDTKTSTFVAGEVLSRWKHKGELIPPNDFIPLFEKNGLISTLDYYVLKETLTILRRWMDRGLQIVPLSINFSRVNFCQHNFFETILEIVDSYNVPHKYIEFEITESAYIEFEDSMIYFISQCKKHDFKVLMDDFGSGYSSLNSLKDLDVALIKIDYKFLQKSHITSRRNEILTSVISLSRTIGVPVVVEGVETEEDANFFKQLGVRFLQGFYFGHPMPVEEFEKLDKFSQVVLESKVSSPIINDITEASSTSNFLFNNNSSYAGIFKFDCQHLYCVLANEKISTSSFLELTDMNKYYDVLESVPIEDKPNILLKLKDICQNKTKDHQLEFKLFYGDAYHRMISTIYCIQKEDNYCLLLIQCLLKPEIVYSNITSNSFSKEQIKFLYDNVYAGIVIINKSRKITYFNKSFLRFSKNVKIGDSCQANKIIVNSCDDCPIFNHLNTYRNIYMPALQACGLIYSTEVTIDGEKCNIVHFRESIDKIYADGDESVYRMLNSIHGLASFYTEINLKTGEYVQTDYSEHTYFNIPVRGNYDEVYGKIHRQIVDSINFQNIDSVFSLKGLRHASKLYRSFSERFKLKDKNIFLENNVSFFNSPDGDFASVYTKDVTSDVLKDCDSLTGLLNRSAGKKETIRYLSTHTQKQIIFAIFDIDYFKNYNDKYGHPIGDSILIEIAEALKKHPDKFTILTRMGGDEFAFIVRNVDMTFNEHNVKKELNEIVESIGNKLNLQEKLGISIGFSTYPIDGTNYADLYQSADKKLYENKRSRNIER